MVIRSRDLERACRRLWDRRSTLVGWGTGSVFEYYQRHWPVRLDALVRNRRPLCRKCLDWSERRSHLGGTLGAAIFEHMLERKWAAQSRGSRIVRFAKGGEQRIARRGEELDVLGPRLARRADRPAEDSGRAHGGAPGDARRQPGADCCNR